MASGQEVKNSIFTIRRQSYEPGRPTPQSLAADVDRFLASGGRIESVPGFTGDVPLRMSQRKPLPAEDRFNRKRRTTPRGIAGQKVSEGYYTVSGAASYLGMTYESLLRLVTEGKGPRIADVHINAGGRVSRYFLKPDLDEYKAIRSGQQ